MSAVNNDAAAVPVAAAAAAGSVVVVNTFVGCRKQTTSDCVGLEAGVALPSTICLAGDDSSSLLFIDNNAFVSRVHLPATSQQRTALRTAIATGIAAVSKSLSTIRPLIDLMTTYAVSDGTNQSNFPSPPCHACTYARTHIRSTPACGRHQVKWLQSRGRERVSFQTAM